jgi:hypothetical protein
VRRSMSAKFSHGYAAGPQVKKLASVGVSTAAWPSGFRSGCEASGPPWVQRKRWRACVEGRGVCSGADGSLVHQLCGWVGYVSATNVAFVRSGFPGYDTTLTQGGDEVGIPALRSASPRTAVMVTNGGFGGVQQALANGVPLVVAGATEDKKEVAARVAWSGTGVKLRTPRPSPRALRRAVQRVLTRPDYGVRARQLRQRTAELGDPVQTILDSLTSEAVRMGSNTRESV